VRTGNLPTNGYLDTGYVQLTNGLILEEMYGTYDATVGWSTSVFPGYTCALGAAYTITKGRIWTSYYAYAAMRGCVFTFYTSTNGTAYTEQGTASSFGHVDSTSFYLDVNCNAANVTHVKWAATSKEGQWVMWSEMEAFKAASSTAAPLYLRSNQ
jgi:hypothetical protein